MLVQKEITDAKGRVRKIVVMSKSVLRDVPADPTNNILGSFGCHNETIEPADIKDDKPVCAVIE